MGCMTEELLQSK